jgi:hypothetical protein
MYVVDQLRLQAVTLLSSSTDDAAKVKYNFVLVYCTVL